ncbi:MAG: ATP-binding protein, partial [Draconibacterium sp.]|nr:ATP-binding protein [Draconibacterium sp.]
GRIKAMPEKIAINIIVAENFSLMNTSANEKEITLKNSLNENLEFFADYDMINTVMRNLISNAIKFTPEKGTIEIIERKVSDHKIEIGISDSGIGIEAETLSKLFSTDSHISTSGTNNEAGTGLGLKLCKELIERNNGEIFIESEVGKGTTVWISLPIKQ